MSRKNPTSLWPNDILAKEFEIKKGVDVFMVGYESHQFNLGHFLLNIPDNSIEELARRISTDLKKSRIG
jgi:hypothetical protein